MSTSCQQFRLTLYMRTSIFSVLHLQDLSLQRSLLRLHVRKALLPSATELQVRVTTSFVLSFLSKLLHRTSRLSLHGDSLSGLCSHVRMRSHSVRHTASIFHLMQSILTAVTVTSGTSAMRALSLRILQMSQTTMTFWFSQLHLRRHLMSLNTSILTSRRATL